MFTFHFGAVCKRGLAKQFPCNSSLLWSAWSRLSLNTFEHSYGSWSAKLSIRSMSGNGLRVAGGIAKKSGQKKAAGVSGKRLGSTSRWSELFPRMWHDKR
jgi:hypothetical protein